MQDQTPHVDYDQRLHAHYHQGRAHDESVMRQWREILRGILGRRPGRTVLDLGSGTGRFSALLADELQADVVGVEPSDKMREVAETQAAHPRVRYLKGAAESIPLPDASCDAAWLSQILHHVHDVGATAAEVGRVLSAGGTAIIRGNHRGRLAGFCRFYDFFPTALDLDERRHPSVDEVTARFEEHGLQRASLSTVEQIEARNLSEYAHRIRLRTYSTFELISAEAFDEGLRALERAAQQSGDEPVLGRLDVIVFRRA